MPSENRNLYLDSRTTSRETGSILSVSPRGRSLLPLALLYRDYVRMSERSGEAGRLRRKLKKLAEKLFRARLLSVVMRLRRRGESVHKYLVEACRASHEGRAATALLLITVMYYIL